MLVTTLQRTLGLGQAIMIGLASMLGAGVFFVWAPAAAVAGRGLLIGLLIATVVATMNALSTAQLAMVHPVSGGTYAYARETIGPWTGFAAGWLFLAGKTASVGAIALVAGGYLWPAFTTAFAVVAVVVFAIVNMTGVRSTAAVSIGIVVIVLSGLVAVVLSVFLDEPGSAPLGAGAFEWARVVGGGGEGQAGASGGDAGGNVGGPFDILSAAGLLFFSFAGYARMATLGEEVREPRRTLPRAIVLALGIVLVIYVTIGVLSLGVLGADDLASSSAPVADLVGAATPLGVTVRAVAGIACLGSLTAVLAGLSRTSLAMARESDLPGPLARISPRTKAPVLAEAVMAGLAIVGILVLDPARLIGFSSCAVLGYYAIANLAALRQPVAERWMPRAVQVVGLVGCLTLALTLPWQAIAFAAVVLALGLGGRLLAKRASRT